jgi:hypothetical protein|tara:strand:- start:46 stop:237 length:192 start_codon:yes stop_codon:yes gene_type:complete
MITNFVNELAKDIMFTVASENICHAKLNDKQLFDLTEEKFKNLLQKRLLTLFEELNPPHKTVD